MSTESEQARLIAERVAKRLSDSPTSSLPTEHPSSNLSGELAAMRSGLNELQKRLAQIEAKVRATGETPHSHHSGPTTTTTRPAPLTHSPWLAGVNASIAHPSEERFGVEEATISELVDYFEKEKTCSLEPGGKPCDHCAMCSTRGF
jgi:hypothetical protein